MLEQGCDERLGAWLRRAVGDSGWWGGMSTGRPIVVRPRTEPGQRAGRDLLARTLPLAVSAPHFPPVWFPPRGSDRSLKHAAWLKSHTPLPQCQVIPDIF